MQIYVCNTLSVIVISFLTVYTQRFFRCGMLEIHFITIWKQEYMLVTEFIR